MKDISYLLAIGLTILLFLHMILTPLLQPDKKECSQDFLQAYGAYQDQKKKVASWSR